MNARGKWKRTLSNRGIVMWSFLRGPGKIADVSATPASVELANFNQLSLRITSIEEVDALRQVLLRALSQHALFVLDNAAPASTDADLDSGAALEQRFGETTDSAGIPVDLRECLRRVLRNQAAD